LRRPKGAWTASPITHGIPVAVIQLLPGSAFLRIDSTGITFASLYRKTFWPWSAIDRFCEVTMKQTGVKGHEMVGFDFAPAYDRSNIGRKVGRVVAGCEGALPDTYGMKAAELAALLTSRLKEARQRLAAELYGSAARDG
jgi:hypothetical protein